MPIYDFVNAHHHFSDPDWDGEPVEEEPCPTCGMRPCICEAKPRKPCNVCNQNPCEFPEAPCDTCGQIRCVCKKKKKAKVKLADGKERNIQHVTMTSFWHPDAMPMSAQFFSNEDKLRRLWSAPDTRAKLLKGLAEKGFGHDQLAEMHKIMEAEKSDLFDVLVHVVYALPPLSREERAARAKVKISTHFNSKQQAFLAFVLSH